MVAKDAGFDDPESGDPVSLVGYGGLPLPWFPKFRYIFIVQCNCSGVRKYIQLMCAVPTRFGIVSVPVSILVNNFKRGTNPPCCCNLAESKAERLQGE